jgi:hypothetical protein
MAIGKLWEEYFEKKSQSKLIDQLKVINYSLHNLDEKIIDEFQLSHLNIVKHIITEIIEERRKSHHSQNPLVSQKKNNSMGGVF